MACPYCEKIIIRNDKCYKNDIENCDKIISRGPRIVLTPTLGMFLEGHLLAVTIEHIPCIACLPEQSIVDIFLFLQNIISRISSIFSPYCIFEHGVGIEDKRENNGQLSIMLIFI